MAVIILLWFPAHVCLCSARFDRKWIIFISEARGSIFTIPLGTCKEAWGLWSRESLSSQGRRRNTTGYITMLVYYKFENCYCRYLPVCDSIICCACKQYLLYNIAYSNWCTMGLQKTVDRLFTLELYHLCVIHSLWNWDFIKYNKVSHNYCRVNCDCRHSKYQRTKV